MAMFIILITFLAIQGVQVQALPLPVDRRAAESSCGDSDCRTIWNIIWSCLATIFACTWLAVHPNVPLRNITTKGAISCAIEQVKIMAITILAPEAIVAWAAEQFIVAWKLRHSEYFISS